MKLEHHLLNKQIQLCAFPNFKCEPELELQLLINNDAASLALNPHPRLKLIKHNRNREIFYFEAQNGGYYIKRFFATSATEKFKNTLLNKAVNSLRIANQLSYAGFHVAEPILALTSKKTFESIYIAKKLPDISVEEFLNQDIPLSFKNKGIISLISMFARFYRDGYIHCDPKLSNFMIHATASGYEIGLIDLEAIYHLPKPVNIFTYKGVAKLYSFSYDALDRQYLKHLRQIEQLQYYLNKFLEIYNPDLNPNGVEAWIAKLVSKRLKNHSMLH